MQVKLDGNTIADVVAHMSEIMQEQSQSHEAIALADEIREAYPNAPDKDLAQIIGAYFYKISTFEPDPLQTQRIKTINRLMRDGRANCVQYTVAIGAVALAMGRPVTIRTVAYQKPNVMEHVYPLIGGVPCDVVIGQRQGGDEHLMRKLDTWPQVGVELPYISAADTNVNF